MTTQPVINPSEYEEIMLNILNKMDTEFGGVTFAKMCKKKGIPIRLIQYGITTRFLKENCLRVGDNRKSKWWRKKEDFFKPIENVLGIFDIPKIKRNPEATLFDIKKSMNQFSFKPEIQQAIDLLKSEGCFEITYQIKQTL